MAKKIEAVFNDNGVDKTLYIKTIAERVLCEKEDGGTIKLNDVINDHADDINKNADDITALGNNKQNKLNRTVTGNDNATGTVTDTGGNISVPVSTTLPTVSATSTQNTSTSAQTLRAVLTAFRNNIAHLFSNKQDKISAGTSGRLRTSSGTAGTLNELSSTVGSTQLPVYINAGVPTALTAANLKTGLGLNNVNNTSDANKPISTAMQTALDGKQDKTAKVSTYDVVIRTQAEFENLYNSSTWLGAKSVAFVGDGRTLKFTRSGTGLLIPSTVKQIAGFNNAIIEVKNITANSPGLYYSTLPTTSDYSVKDITANVTGTLAGNRAYGFQNCLNVINCSASSRSGGNAEGYGFKDCSYLVNCTGYNTAAGIEGYGFKDCSYLVNCTGYNTAAATAGFGFKDCSYLVNCTGYGKGQFSGHGFYGCSHLANCIGSGDGQYSGYGFYGCSHLNGCKEGEPLSSTGIWGGTWLYRDDQSCQLER